ncbi:MAG TPA: hypothetical protein VIM53_00755 [Candidatus Saccharimonadales bacterium]
MSNPEFGAAPDFTAEIEMAIAHAASTNPLAPTNGSPNYSAQVPNLAALPHDHIDSTLPPIDTDAIFTTNSSDYYHALIQAARAVATRNGIEGGAPKLDRIGEAHRHEVSHGKAIEENGNSQTLAHYAVRFAIMDDGRCRMFPFVTRSGPLRKVHDAFSAAAPAFLEPRMSLSGPDKEIIAEWGYDPANLTDLKIQALWTPPVPEGWTPA